MDRDTCPTASRAGGSIRPDTPQKNRNTDFLFTVEAYDLTVFDDHEWLQPEPSNWRSMLSDPHTVAQTERRL